MDFEETFENKRVLVLDDDRVVLHVIMNVLDDMGFEVKEALDGNGARQLLDSEKFDLLISDKNLPDGSGLDVLKHAKEIDINMGTLLVTAYASRESVEEAMAVGVDDYIVKPFDIMELVEKVKQSMQRRLTRSNPNLKLLKTDSVCEKVIVLDPDETSRKVSIDVLAELGYEPVVVDEIDMVLDELARASFRGIICDLDSLDNSGKVQGFLRTKLDFLPNTHLVVISSERSFDRVVAALSQGANRILYRPMNSRDKVLASLRRLLGSIKDPSGNVKVLIARRYLDEKTVLKGNFVDVMEISERDLTQDMMTVEQLDEIVGEPVAVPRLKGDLILFSSIKHHRMS